MWENIKTRKELNNYKNNVKLTQEQKEILIGGLLGDLNLRKIGNYSRLVVEQKNKEYLFHLYEIFKDFIRTPPKERLQQRLETSEIKSTWYFSTISHLEFEEYYQLFYKNKIKIIPENIEELLTARSIAYWYMDDGSKAKHTYCLHTCSFTSNEHLILKNSLKNKFNITCTTHEKARYNYLYITTSDLSNIKFYSIIKPYIINSMQYKI